MKKLFLTVVMVTMIFTLAQAEQKYNPYSDRWETVSECEDQLTYNPYEDSWSYEMEGSEIEYNPYEDSWEYTMEDCGQGRDRY